MAASTAASWEGSMGAPKKKGSAGMIFGAIAGVALLAGAGIAVLVLGGGGTKDSAAATNVIPAPSTDVKSDVAPAVSLGGEVPTATASATTTAIPPSKPTTTAPIGGKPGKPTASASASASAKPTASATATPLPPTTTTVTQKPSHPGLEDDRK